LIESAHRKTGQRMTELGDDTGKNVVLAEPAIQARWVRAFDYLKELAPAFAAMKAQIKRERSGMSEEDWEKQRQTSKTYNLERFNVCDTALLVLAFG
jgi:hypothetical protein